MASALMKGRAVARASMCLQKGLEGGTIKKKMTRAVGVFWDLENKHPDDIPPYDAAYRLRMAASAMGPLRFIAAYAKPDAFLHTYALVPCTHYICRICNRNFRRRPDLLLHFKGTHEREHAKHLNRINAARGARRVHIAATLSMKIKRFNKIAREIQFDPHGEGGYVLADELNRAGVTISKVDESESAAGLAIREHMLNEMDRGRITCFVLISNDLGFISLLKEARRRCLMTAVIGDNPDGALKRHADASFSWRDVVSGKMRDHAVSAVWKYKDKDLLKDLEWRYQPSKDGKQIQIEDGDAMNLKNLLWNKADQKLHLDHEGDSIVRSSSHHNPCDSQFSNYNNNENQIATEI